jgi:glycosyltransferase involved in cell wall biosynthesis
MLVSPNGSAASRRRILVLTPRFPYPPAGGDRLRIYQICKQLSSEFELSLLSMCESDEEMEAPIQNDGVFSQVERVFHGKWPRMAGCLRALPTRTPFQVGYYRNAFFEKRVHQLASQHHCLLAHLIRTGPYIAQFKLPKILEMTDAISLSYQRTVEHVDPVKAALYRIEADRLLKFERNIALECDLCVLVSDVDRNFLFPSGAHSNVLVCSNGVDSQAFPFRFHPDGKTVIFIGKNSTRPNMDGIMFFVREVMPLARARVPQVQFRVIGQISAEFRRKLENHGVIVTGTVANVAEAARGASVGVCPLRMGAGVQNKVLEYMALGVPAVTSPIGLEGLEAVSGVHVMTATKPQDWADQIGQLLQDRDLAQNLAVAGRRFVEAQHSWPSQISKLTNSIHKLIEDFHVKD